MSNVKLIIEVDDPNNLHALLVQLSDDLSGAAIINSLERIETLMSTQEERLQAISSKIDEVLNDLATLRTNNPQIEDEISAIEAKLSIAQPTTEPTPTEPTV
jgi:predicted  nucleic acid-binding Zn-ribbon protein